MSILTYDNRLQLGLIADKNLITHESEAKGILDGIYKYLDELESEVNCSLLQAASKKVSNGVF